MTAARKWFPTLGLDGLEQRRSGELSGGQAQRVALAGGLVAAIKVLFADEPTGSLDSVSGELVMDLLTAAVQEHRRHRGPGHPRRPGRRLLGPRGRRQGRQGRRALTGAQP